MTHNFILEDTNAENDGNDTSNSINDNNNDDIMNNQNNIVDSGIRIIELFNIRLIHCYTIFSV